MRKKMIMLGMAFAMFCLLLFSGLALARTTLVVWDIMTESNQYYPAFDAANARFRELYPDVELKHVPIQNDNYKTKLRTAMAADNTPDIFMTWGSAGLKKYVDNNKVFDLTDDLSKEWQARFAPAAMGLGNFDGRQYGLPITNTAVSLLWYRKDMFEKYGLTPPQTFEELLAVGQVLKQNGITPFALANKNKWTGSMYFMYLVDRIGGPGTLQKALNRSGAFNDAPFIEAGQKLQQMVDLGFFPKGVNGLDEDTGQSRALLYADKAAMYLMGSWFVGVVKLENPAIMDKMDFVVFPAVKGGRGNPGNLVGTFGDLYFSISADSEHKEAALNYLKLISDDTMAQELVKAGCIPPLTGSAKYIDDPVLQKVAEIAQRAESVQLWYDQSLPLELTQVHLNTTQALFDKSITPEEAANKMEATAQEYFGK